MTRVAAIQMASGPNVGANLTEAERWISQAAEAGAQLIVLPENFAIIGIEEEDKVNVKEQEGSGQIQDFLKNQAARHGVWIVAGTIPLAASDEKRIMIKVSRLHVTTRCIYLMYMYPTQTKLIMNQKP